MTDSPRPASRSLLSPLSVLATASLALALTSCSALSSGSDAGTPASQDGTLTVSASFYPVQYLVQAVGGEHVTVTSVTPSTVEPHDFELSPKDVTSLGEADLVAYVSGFQPSLDDAVQQVSGPTVLDLALDVDLEQHESEHEEAAEHEGTGEAEEHDHSHEGSVDPHFWLDPVRMRAAASAVETALTKADPAHASDYAANLATLTNGLTSLDASLEEGLSQCERTTFVTSHAAFGYLAERYALTQESVSGVDPESEPSPADLAEIKKVVQETGTTTVFTEDLVSPKTAQALAAETGASTAVLTPLESAPADGDYVSAMTANKEALRTALACQ